MSKVTRKIRIDLSEIYSEWVDSYMVLSTISFTDKIEYQKRLTKIGIEQGKNNRELEKVQNKIASGVEGLEEQELQLEEAGFGYVNKQIEIMQKHIANRFVEGKIMIDDKLEDLSKQDIFDFDEHVLKIVLEQANGEITKKN